MDQEFFVHPEELRLRFTRASGEQSERKLSFHHFSGAAAEWRSACRDKLAQLTGIRPNVSAVTVRELRRMDVQGVSLRAFIMECGPDLSLPGYLLVPSIDRHPGKAVMAIHGHGEVEPCLGLDDDYHHRFALELALAGHLVCCPELRGFGALRDLAAQRPGSRLDYWQWGSHMAYSLVTDAFQHNRTLIGETAEDLLCWERWLGEEMGVESTAAVGISYGGDLALLYPVFSRRVERIFASGTLGSFAGIFEQDYNAPAHCIPGILAWMDRSDIAGLNAPRKILLHYGELDVPGPENFSASYNASVPTALRELREIYHAFAAGGQVDLYVSPGLHHEMDISSLLAFLD